MEKRKKWVKIYEWLEKQFHTMVGVVGWYVMPGLFEAVMALLSVIIDDGYGEAELKFISVSFIFP